MIFLLNPTVVERGFTPWVEQLSVEFLVESLYNQLLCLLPRRRGLSDNYLLSVENVFLFFTGRNFTPKAPSSPNQNLT